MLFGCYRRGDANDPERYVTAITAVLARYDTELIREVTDPNTGIQTTEKFETFLPNVGELKRYCDARVAHLDSLKRLGPPMRPRAYLPCPPKQPGDQATIFVPTSSSHYPALLEWSETADPRLWKLGRSSDNREGMWIAWGVWERRAVVRRERPVATKLADAAPAPEVQP